MNHDLPHVKTVKLLFVAMDDQQQAMFKMAFKMHNTTNYQVINAGSGEMVWRHGKKQNMTFQAALWCFSQNHRLL